METMIGSRWVAILGAVMLVVAACSDVGAPQDAASLASPAESPDTAEKTDDGSSAESAPANDDGEARDEEPSKKTGSASQDGGDSDSREVAFAHPTKGHYAYDQSGWEEFCQATCDRDTLPDTQPVSVRLDRAEDGSVTVTVEARPSKERTARTTAQYTDSSALVTDVYTSYEYAGFEFSTAYQPDPPVPSLLFPLRVGKQWSAKWEAETSGEYHAAIVGREVVATATGDVDAYKIDTEMDFRGEFDGSAVVTLWIDPESLSVVMSEGRLEASSRYGDYRTKFETVLRSGPGY
jgi:hypothetical protein